MTSSSIVGVVSPNVSFTSDLYEVFGVAFGVGAVVSSASCVGVTSSSSVVVVVSNI